jgi:hypothetical protein
MSNIAGSGSNSQRHGSEDPDPPQNVMDPQHWLFQTNKTVSAKTTLLLSVPSILVHFSLAAEIGFVLL